MTPLHLAAERARVKVIEYLVGREANIVNIQDLNRVNILCVTACINDERLHSVYYFWGFQALEIVHMHHSSVLYIESICLQSQKLLDTIATKFVSFSLSANSSTHCSQRRP